MESGDDRTAMDGRGTEAPGGTPEIDELRRELAEKNDRLLRALAEADNTRRRAQRDREDAVRFAAETLVRDVIPVIDNLDRALDAARAAGESSAIVDGVDLIRREFLKVLERHGVTRYSALGERFDPNHHEAIARVVSLDKEPDTVVGETVPGYSLRGRVLRPAQVAVAAAPDEDAA
ncbi:MAG: nucleotide exchange factor GrpE [Candidatus Rokubacteria bacterium]|nr:nucleotide exchange factor GrpE [Candidatus Rokubacteria bacterium]